jgi:hypothetical protein
LDGKFCLPFFQIRWTAHIRPKLLVGKYLPTKSSGRQILSYRLCADVNPLPIIFGWTANFAYSASVNGKFCLPFSQIPWMDCNFCLHLWAVGKYLPSLFCLILACFGVNKNHIWSFWGILIFEILISPTR